MTERFTLLTELGRGGMGVVWKARDEQTGQIVALKVMREIYAEDADYVARFERELELAKRINSVHVVKVLGFGVRQKMPYLALEYVDGPSLHDALARHGPYSWPEARTLLVQLTQGLADAHAAGVIHRDVKPSNVLIGPDGVAKLTDFGIARGLDTTRMTATSTMIGTPAYLAPEGPKDARSDLYSLGIIGYQLLTGAPPFVGQTYQEVLLAHIRDEPDLGRLPAETRAIISWLLAKEPAKRARNAWEVIPVLEGRLFLMAPAPQAAPKAAAVAASTAPISKPAAISARPEPAVVAPVPRPARSVARAGASPETGRTGATRATAGDWVLVSAPQAAGYKIERRAWHTASVLDDGWVLLTGGRSDGQLSSAVLFHPGRGSLGRTMFMNSPRQDHTAVTLDDGSVLVCGGTDEDALAAAEVFDVEAGVFVNVGSMTTKRQLHTTTLMPGGLALVTGGWDGRRSLSTCDAYEPISRRFHRIAAMSEGRDSHTATLLRNEMILVAGGEHNGAPTRTCEIYDPAVAAFERVGPMSVPRTGHTATLLADGTCLIIGGESLRSAECFDRRSGTFTSVGPMRVAREGHTATLLENGLVMIVGGANDTGALISVEAFDPADGTIGYAGRLKTARVDHTASLLPDGRVLIAGGLGSNGTPLDSIEILSLETVG
jgi:hypothetical protein